MKSGFMSRISVAALMLSGCAGNAPECVTSLGVQILGTIGEKPSPYSCDDFEAVQADIMAELPESAINGIIWERVRGYRIMFHPEEKWEVMGQMVAGRTWCPPVYYIELGTSPHHLAWTAFTHELVHAAQGCYAAPPTDPGMDVDHANWQRAGIYQATNNVAAKYK